MAHENITMILVIFILVVNILWYSAKFSIRANGGESNLIRGHFRDFAELKILMSPEYSARTQIEAKFYFYGIPLTVLGIIIPVFILVSSNA